jgi:hypothetical protein
VPPSVEQWLNAHHSVRQSVIWATPIVIEAYTTWPQSRKDDLQTAFDKAWNFDSVHLTDPPPNILHPDDHEAPTTALSHEDALWLYLATVAQSLAVEIGNRVPWSLTGYSSENLEILLDSRQYYTWGLLAGGYEIQDLQGGYVVPASPNRMHQFLKDKDLIGEHRRGTIGRTLQWCHDKMTHNFGAHTTKVYEHVWQYRGEAPVRRIMAGTKDDAHPAYGVRHWTAGCHGTAGFLRAVLRTVNIPVVHDHQAGHALPYFSADDAHLSHGDDPYNGYTFADPPYSMAELLIDHSTFDAWFGPGVSEDAREKHVGKRVQQLAIDHLPAPMLQDYCTDKAAGASHADGAVKANMPAYTVAELESHHLWSRLEAKVASLGGCSQIPG